MAFSRRWLSLSAVLLTVPLATLSGCGAIINGTSTTMPATSTPAGAQVSVDGIPVGVTPMQIRLSHDKDHVVTFRFADGREQMVPIGKQVKAGYIVLDVLLAGIVGVVVDAVTGGWYGPEVDSVHGAPTAAPKATPPATEQARTAPADRGRKPAATDPVVPST